jgi:predicted porin
VNHLHRIAAASCCLFASCCLPSISFADTPSSSSSSVVLYGIIDSGFEYINNAAPPAVKGQGNEDLFRATSGNMSGSRWGLKGVEDLGGGTKTFFLLESGFNATSGASLQGGRLFGRLAYVGLADKTFGSVSLGRQGGLFLDWMSKYNPLDNAVYAIKMQDTAFSDRLDNTARYEKKFGPVDALVQYSAGYDTVTYGTQPPGNTLQARVIEAGLRYTLGNLSAALVYDQKNGGSTSPTAAHTTKVGGYYGDMDRRIGVGLKYRAGATDLFAGYRYLNSQAIHLSALDTGPVEASSLYWLGTTYHATYALNFSGTAMYQKFYGTARAPLSFQVSSDYFLSKRTDVYVNLGYVINRNGSDLGLNGFGSANNVVPGTNQFGTQAGIRHTF